MTANRHRSMDVFLCTSTLLLIPAAAPVAANTIYVDDSATNGLDDGSSWADAYIHLQDALANAATNGAVQEIWVRPGTYKPDKGKNQKPGDRAASFQLLNGVALSGGCAGLGALNPDLRDRDLRTNSIRGGLAGAGDDLPQQRRRQPTALPPITGAGTENDT